jgi:cytidyltransferase-like protein
MKTVVIFGVFDGVHEGHREFIKQARVHGDQLVAIVARDSVVEKRKGKLPLHTETLRIKALLEIPEIDLVLLGDVEEGSYHALKEANPQVVFLGYDQEALFASIKIALEKGVLSNIELIFGDPYKPEVYHSSILNTDHESTNEKLPELSE